VQIASAIPHRERTGERQSRRVWRRLAYNLGNFLRRLALPRSVRHWSLIPMYIGTSREAHQDRGEGCHAFTVRVLPDGRGRRAAVAVPGDPGADTMVAAARDGAGMTASTVETAGEGGGGGDGLRGSPMNAPTQGVLGGIMAWQRPGTPSTEQKECLPTSRSAIDSSERPTAADGQPGNPG